MSPVRLNGRRVLVVEDELLIAMSLQAALEDAGYDVVGPLPRLGAGLAEAERAPLDAAVLDVTLGGEKSFPIAETLARRGIPFVFLTGYGIDSLPESWRDRPALAKPFDPPALVRALAGLPPAARPAP